MAELPPTLDDEKHWVPADILPDEVTYMEELAQQLSSYTLCEHQPQQQQQQQQQTQTKIVANAKPVKVQPNQNTLVSRGTGVYTCDQGGAYRALTTGYQFPPVITSPPVVATPTQGGGFVQTSTRARAQQNQGGGGNWFLPFQANVRVGGFAKGTGVFLPRVDPIEATRKKGISCDENYCYKAPVKRNANKKNSGGKKEVVGLKATTEISLPQEWTY